MYNSLFLTKCSSKGVIIPTVDAIEKWITTKTGTLRNLKTLKRGDFLYVDALNIPLTQDDFESLVNVLIFLNTRGVLIQALSYANNAFHFELDSLEPNIFTCHTFSRDHNSLDRHRLLLVFNYNPYDF